MTQTPHIEIRFVFVLPDERLRAFIPAYWDIVVTGPGVVEDLLRPEWMAIRMVFSGTWLFGSDKSKLAPLPDKAILHGVAMRAQWAQGTEGRIFCAAIMPMGWHRLLDGDASDCSDQVSPLHTVLGDGTDLLFASVEHAADLEARVVAADDFFLARLAHTQRTGISDQIEAVSLAIADAECATVKELAKRADMSAARLARFTKKHFGFLPKKLIQRQRFLRMLHSMEGMSVGQWPHFLDPQYVDQSHMIRDFHKFIGMSPTQYFAMERPLLAAVFQTLMAGIKSGEAEGLSIEEGRQVMAFRPDTGKDTILAKVRKFDGASGGTS